MSNMLLSNFLNKAVQTSNRRVVPTEFISDAIGLFDNEETRLSLLGLADIKKKDLILSENSLKKQIKIFEKPHKALSLKLTINNINKIKKTSDQNSQILFLKTVEKPKNLENLIEIQYALVIHYGNGKQSSSQTIATYSEFFDVSEKDLAGSQIGVQYKSNESDNMHLKFEKTKHSSLFI